MQGPGGLQLNSLPDHATAHSAKHLQCPPVCYQGLTHSGSRQGCVKGGGMKVLVGAVAST